MTHTLGVFDGQARVGKVEFEPMTETFSFHYAEAWKTSPQAYPLSPVFPLNATPDGFGSIRRFIENLLPEGRVLDIVASSQHIAKNNIFGLIREIGKETTGALSFLPEDTLPARDDSPLRAIPYDELRQRLAERETIPLSAWDGRVRLSIAGYQDKLAVYMQDDKLFLSNDRYASTHILKPEPLDERMAGLVVNEHFCMQLAGHMKLPVAKVAIQRLPAPVLVVERFDRKRIANGVCRVHTLDACQALDLPVSYKYERNFGSGRDVRQIRDGVSFKRLFSITRFTPKKAVAQLGLLRWALLQYVLGNADAHGKNISFYSRREGLELAPFYDLVSVVQFPGVTHELAMAFGDEFDLDAIRPFDFADFAVQTSIPRTLLAREMARMAKDVEAAAEKQAASPEYLPSEQAQVARLRDFVKSQAKSLRLAAKPMLAIPEDELHS